MMQNAPAITNDDSTDTINTIESQSTPFSVTLPNGSRQDYVLRGLEETEIDEWADFCASIFAYKALPPPASYFARHYHNDPRKVARLIRVAFLVEDGDSGGGGGGDSREPKKKRMVASCRIFLKTILGGGAMQQEPKQSDPNHRDSFPALIEAGGIGEVCTDPAHRKRGLSKALLQNCLAIMKERRDVQASFLHAAPAFYSVYEKAGGYRCGPPIQWTVLPYNMEITNDEGDEGMHIRRATFPRDLKRLSQLHRSYSETKLTGCVIRSDDYWEQYLSNELKDSLWVLEGNGSGSSSSAPVAWISVRRRGPSRIQLREFGMDSTSTTVAAALRALLSKAIFEEKAVGGPFYTSSDGCISFALPKFVAEELRQEVAENETLFKFESSFVEEDCWMYKFLDPCLDFESFLKTELPAFVWPSDSF